MGFKEIFKTAFPFISTASTLGGPIGIMAASAVGAALGVEKLPSSPEKVQELFSNALAKNDPETMIKLKQVENDFALRMKQLGIESVERLEEIAASDRASARAREIAVKDKIPAILALSTMAGFFALLALLTYHGVPAESHDIVIAMTGVLGGSGFTSVMTYYFGSSAGSARKTALIAEQLDKP